MNLHDLESLRVSVQIQLDDLLAENGGEVTPAVDAIADRLLAFDMAIEEKLDRYAYVIKSMEAEAERLGELEFQIITKQRKARWAAERLKARVQEFIERNVPEKKVKCELHTLSVCDNGGKLPLVFDEDAAPSPGADFCKPRWEWDTEAIRGSLEAGHDLPFARLGERGKHLRIR